jgi:hypothetical protein
MIRLQPVMSGWSAAPDLPDPFPTDPDVPISSQLEVFAERYPLFWSVFGPDAPPPNSAPDAASEPLEDPLIAEVRDVLLEKSSDWDPFLDAVG